MDDSYENWNTNKIVNHFLNCSILEWTKTKPVILKKLIFPMNLQCYPNKYDMANTFPVKAVDFQKVCP